MSLKSVRTLTAAQLAKKWNLSLAEVRKLIEQGAKVEREHTKSEKEASEIARDHISERPDYYKRLKKIEESGTAGVRGLGNVSGDPSGTNYVQMYIDSNSMSYNDENGNKFKWIRKHTKNHNKVGFKEYDPRKLKEGISTEPERDIPVVGDLTGSSRKVAKVEEKTQGYQSWPGEKKKKFFSGPKDDSGKTETQKWAERRQKEREAKKQMNEFDTSSLPMSQNIVDRRKGSASGGATPQNLETPTTAMGAKGGSTTSSTTTPSNTGASGRSFPLDKQGKLDRVELRRQSEKDYESKTPSQMNEISAELVGKVHNKRMEKKQNISTTLSRAVRKKWLESEAGKVKDKKKIDEDAATIDAMSHMRAPQIERPGYSRSAPTITQKLNSTRSGPARGSLSGQSGSFRPTNLTTRAGTTIQRAAPARPISARMNASQGGSMTGQVATQRAPAPRSITTSPSMGGGQSPALNAKASVTSRAMQGSRFSITQGMSKAGTEAAKSAATKAVGAAAGRAAGALGGVAGAVATTVGPELGKMAQASYKAGHQSFKPHGDEGEKASTVFARMKQPSQGRSISQYEKDVLTPKKTETPAAPKQTADVPTPPSRPEYFTRGQAFSAARKEAGGGEGKFSYQSGSDTAPKEYQTNRKDKPEPYKPESQLKQTSVNEETKMDTKEIINEALDNILDNNLVDMKENFMAALQEKAMEKLEEKRKEIASNYFAQ